MRRRPTRSLRRLLPLAGVLVALLAPAPAAAATLGCSDDARGTTNLSAWVPEMLAATNAHRATKGLAPLRLDATLSKASLWKSRDLAARGYFAHDDPAGGGAPARSPWERLVACGFTSGGTRAENIAAGQRTGAAFVAAWIASPGHRANIENASLRYVGFGVVSLASSPYGTYATQMFSSEPGPATTTTTDPTRELQEGLAPTRIAVGATVTKFRCRSRMAVRGWCYVTTIRGRLTSTTAAAAAARRVAVARRTSARRYASVGASTTRSDGRFLTRRFLRPPATGTRAWLLANARVLRVHAPATATAAASTRVIWARVLA